MELPICSLRQLRLAAVLTDVHTNEELRLLVQQGQETGKIDAAEYKIIKNAFEFSNRNEARHRPWYLEPVFLP